MDIIINYRSTEQRMSDGIQVTKSQTKKSVGRKIKKTVLSSEDEKLQTLWLQRI